MPKGPFTDDEIAAVETALEKHIADTSLRRRIKAAAECGLYPQPVDELLGAVEKATGITITIDPAQRKALAQIIQTYQRCFRLLAAVDRSKHKGST